MNEPEGPGSRQDDEDVVLPSWIDLAIARSKGPAAAGEPSPASSQPLEPEPAEPEELAETPAGSPRFVEPEADSEYADSPYPEPEAVQDEGELTTHEDFESAPSALGSPDAARGSEPFPSFLDRRRPLYSETSAEPAEETYSPAEEHAEANPGSADAASPAAGVAPYPMAARGEDAFDDRRAAIVSEALTDLSRSPGADPVPLPVAPVRRSGSPNPWLMAAIFFAAAAAVLAVLIWLRPVSR